MGKHAMRDISDLRIQQGCEYRLYLQQQLGTHADGSAVRGQRFHAQVKSTNTITRDRWWTVPLFLFIALVAAALWIIS